MLRIKRGVIFSNHPSNIPSSELSSQSLTPLFLLSPGIQLPARHVNWPPEQAPCTAGGNGRLEIIHLNSPR